MSDVALLLVVGCRLQTAQLQHESHEHDAAQHGKTESEVASVGPLAQQVCHGCTGKHAHHVHDTVGCGAILG